MGISSGQSFRRVRQSLFWASVFFGLLIGSLCLRADEVSTAFDQANKLYEQGKYGEAASGYGKLAQAGQVSSALYFNLGNALLKSGELGRAILNYRLAQRLAPRDPDIRVNLRF